LIKTERRKNRSQTPYYQKEEKKVKFKKRAAERKPEKKPTHLTETEMKR